MIVCRTGDDGPVHIPDVLLSSLQTLFLVCQKKLLLFRRVGVSFLRVGFYTVEQWRRGKTVFGGSKAQIFRQRDNFSDKTNSSEPPYNFLFLKVS